MAKSTFSPEHRVLREALAEMRGRAGLSQRAVAKRLRVAHSWVAKVESGERRIDLIEFCWFAAACGRDPAKCASKVIREMYSQRVRKSSRAR